MAKDKRFPALHVISGLFKIMAWLVALADIIGIVFILIGKTPFEFVNQAASKFSFNASPIFLAVSAFVLGAFYFLILYALAEGILVMLAIEENTRKAPKE